MKLAAEPEKEMLDVGNELLEPPVEEEPLLELLGRAELLLTKVEQSPQPAMLRALDPVMKGLVLNELLRHQNPDVKVAVASCISEITRITAPEAPYDDDLMKVIFELIVEAFGGLKETPQSNQMSYRRRLSILETVAKVRSCVVMLDLECDGLILEMFRHFFQARRLSHPENAHSLMETIMTVVLEESEDFSSELISSLLDSVKKDNTDASRELGDIVIGKCGAKLKQYLLKEIHATGTSLNDYSRVVASICQGSSDTRATDELNNLGLEDDRKLSEKSVSEELQQVGLGDVGAGGDKASELAVSNGVVSIDKDESVAEPASPSVHSEQAPHDGPKVTGKNDKIDSLGSKADKGTRQRKSKSRKDSSSVPAAEVSDHSPMDIDKGKEASDHKDSLNSQSEIALDKIPETTTSIDDEKGVEFKPSEHTSDQGGSISDPNRSKRGRSRLPKMPTKKHEMGFPASPSLSKKSSEVEDELPSTKGKKKNLKIVGAHSSDGKPLKSRGKNEGVSEENEKPSSDVPPKEEEEKTGDIQVAPTKGKEVDKVENEPSKESAARKGRSRKSGMTSEKLDAGKGPSETISSPEMANKAKTDKDQDASDEAHVKKARRKRAKDAEDSDNICDETLIGSQIKVWWPDDEKYYPGIVESFDPATKKHKVLYSDGDIEILMLKEEKWMFIEKGKSVTAEDGSSPPPGKRLKASTDSMKRKAKTDSPAKSSAGKSDKKRGGGKPSRLAEGEDANAGTPEFANKQEKSGASSGRKKSTSKSKDGTTDPEEVSGSKDRAPKSAGEIKDETTSRSGKKSKDANPESNTKLKESGGPKSGHKSKGGSTSKSGSKSASNGTAKEKQATEDPSPKVSESSRKRGRAKAV